MPLKKLWAEYFTRDIPAHVVEYLTQQRGLSPEIIRHHQLGWNRFRITIPVFARNGSLAFLKLARLPDDNPELPKFSCWPSGNSAELYGWEHLGKVKPDLLVICEGELDRLVLESCGIPAVTGTAGAGVFLQKWADALSSIPNIYVCLDRDEAGRKGAEHISGMIPHAKIVGLPEEVGHGGDITDFFVRLGKSVDDFRKLLDQAQPIPEEGRQTLSQKQTTAKSGHKQRAIYSSDPRIQFIKQNVALEEIAKNYINELRPSGSTLVGRCPFHADTQPSRVLSAGVRDF